MTDKNNKEIQSRQKKEPSKAERPKKEGDKDLSKKPFKWSNLFIVIALIIASLSLAGAAYVWFQFEHYKQQSASSFKQAISGIDKQLQTKLESQDVSHRILSLVEPLQSHLDTLEKSSQSAAQARDALTESTQKLFELYGRDKNGWQLAEVEYLLRIAQHRLVIENDFQGAAKTLKAADDKISEIADPGLLPVRVAISDERVLLQARTRPDLVGIVLSLSRISKQIPHLNLTVKKQKNTVMKAVANAEDQSMDSNATWQDQVVQFVKGLVKVEPLKKSLSSPLVNIVDAINALEEKLKLAKWAVLERDQRQYQLLMKQSSQLFQQYFDENNNYHIEIKLELERLQALEIRPKLPNISGSLLLLKDIMLQKEHRIIQQRTVNPQLSVEKVNDLLLKEIPLVEDTTKANDIGVDEIKTDNKKLEITVDKKGASNE